MNHENRVKRNSENEEQLPPWFNIDLGKENYSQNDLCLHEALSSSRNEMFAALNLYNSHAHVVISLMIASITAFGFLMVNSGSINNQWGLLIAPCAIYLFALISVVILYQYYDFYVSTLLFATIIHHRAKYIEVHPWLVQLKKYVQDNYIKDKNRIRSQADLRCLRCLRPRFSFFPYALLILLLGLLSFWMPFFFEKQHFHFCWYIISATTITGLFLLYFQRFLLQFEQYRYNAKLIAMLLLLVASALFVVTITIGCDFLYPSA